MIRDCCEKRSRPTTVSDASRSRDAARLARARYHRYHARRNEARFIERTVAQLAATGLRS